MLSVSNKQNTNEKEVKIIDDDVYLQNVEKIIVRDFFPDLPKLETQVRYIEALDRNNTQQLSQLPPKPTKASPLQYATPQAAAPPTPLIRPSDDLHDPLPVTHNALSKKEEARIEKMSLNEYMSRYTSEDNANLVEMVEETRLKKQAANQGYQQRQLEIGESSKAKFWDYEQKNAVMYTPEGVELSAADQLELSQCKKQTIDLSNTRFKVPLYSASTKPASCKHPPLHVEGKIGLDGKEILPSSTPSLKGYRFMGTPSPAPGVDASPLMTWGEIDSTPFRLDGSETPVRGPSFRIAEMCKKERILHELTGKVNKEKRARKAEALRQAVKSMAGTPRARLSTTERLQCMSPAAQRVASEKLKLGYSNFLYTSVTPRRPSSSRLTPGPRTPRTGAPLTPKLSLKRKDATPLTDNLLKLPHQSNNFPKASDFF